jgi:circadian clock protein KaiB
MEKLEFRLYITGKTYRSEQAIDTLRHICDLIGENAEMKVIDILEEPETAEKDKILATPTLIKSSPPTTRRIIGDLSDIDKVIRGLDIDEYITADEKGES